MWLSKIFEREFGFSDVQSNYSRVYAWMANQLGHVTLGMITVLFFVWITETVEAFAAALISSEGWLAALSVSGERYAPPGQNTELTAFLLSIAILAIAAGALVIAIMGLKPNAAQETAWRKDRAALRRRYPAIGPNARRVQLLIAILGSGMLIWHNIPETLSADSLRRCGISVAVAYSGLAIATLCRDWRFSAIGALSLFTIWHIAIPNGGITHDGFRDVLIAGTVFVFLLFSTVVLIGFAPPTERYGRAEALLQIATNLGIALTLLTANAVIETPEWRLAFAGFVASLAIWWLKEFASDLPNVHQEIHSAAILRPEGILGDCTSVERDYFIDARMDARTDGLFYLAGAWIGAGTVSALPVLDGSPWRSGSEILGTIVFVAIFLTVGRNWAYRQLSLDRVGALRAGRLGVFHAGLLLKAVQFDKRGIEQTGDNGERVAHPLTALSAFADDVPLESAAPTEKERRAEEALNPCRHLVLFGASGSGRSPLGRALASEAALAGFPTFFRQKKRPKCRAGTERSARYISANHLLTYLDSIKRQQDVVEAPTIALHFVGGRRVMAEAAFPEDAVVETEPAASVVVIDDLTMADVSGANLSALMKRLDLDPTRRRNAQKTVWLIDAPDESLANASPVDIEEWDAALMKATEGAASLLAALAALSPGDNRRHVGIGLLRRTEPSLPR